jgi:hypothetical protein
MIHIDKEHLYFIAFAIFCIVLVVKVANLGGKGWEVQ